MTDAAPQQPVPSATADLDSRTLVLIVYGLYLGALFCGGISGLAGVILAYIKRDDARGTIWESHYENAIHAFWIWFILMVVGVLTAWFIVGLFVMAAAFLYFLYRTIKGLVRAIDSKPYV